jgi:hypothetical protein
MPLAIPQPSGMAPHSRATLQPYYLREPQRWAVDQERQRHLQALYTVGEWTMFCLMWNLEDFQNGLVTRCSVCYNRSSQAYKQGERNKCPDCFGTTFEGGFRAQHGLLHDPAGPGRPGPDPQCRRDRAGVLRGL